MKLLTLPILLILSTIAHADLTGKWTGTIKTETTGVDLGGIEIQSPKVELVVKADGTYVQNQTNPDGSKKRIEGTWKQDKNKVILLAIKQDGMPVSKEVAKPKEFVLNSKETSMSRDVSSEVKKKMHSGSTQMDDVLAAMKVILIFEKK